MIKTTQKALKRHVAAGVAQDITLYSFEEAAADFTAAIKEIASKPQNLENLESYLSQHFPEWLSKYANSPENIAAEMRDFAKMEF